MLVIDPDDGSIVDANEAAARLYGWSREQLRAMRISEINTLAPESLRLEMDAARREERSHFFFPHRLANGSVRNVEVYSSPVEHEGRRLLLSVILNTTERTEREQALVSEAVTRRIMMEQSRDGIVVVNHLGRVHEANPRFAEMLGYTFCEVQRLHVWDWEHDFNAEKMREMIAPTDAGGDHFETVHRRKDGSTFEVEISTNAVAVDNQKLVFCVCRDVTARKAAEAEIAHSRDLMRHIIEHDRSAIAVHDRDLNYIYVSQRYLADYGVTEEDVIGRHHYDVFPDLPEKWKKVHRRVLAGEVLSAEDDRFERADGSVDWTRWECRPWHEADGSIGGIVIYTEVITDRKQMEIDLRESRDMLANLTDQIPGVVYQYRLDPDGTSCFPYSSKGINDIYEYSPEEVRDDATPVFGRLHPDDLDRILAAIYESAEKLTPFHCEFRMVLPRQGLRWRLSDALPQRLDDGSTLWYGIVSDITDRVVADAERHRAEAEIVRLNEELEERVRQRTEELATTNADLAEATRAKSAFLANMSHELRTPLNSIIGFSGVLEQEMAGPLNEEQRTQLAMIHRSGRHLLELVDEVLDLSKIEARQTSIGLRAFYPADVLREVTDMLDPLASQKNIRLSTDSSEPQMQMISDRGKVRQILLNLAGNAVKFTDSGEVRLEARRSGEEHVEFTVTDTGPGIPENRLEDIFSAFAQVSCPAVAKPSGTGLGLTISREFAHLLEGEVTAASEPGKGSTFTLRLPIEYRGG